MDVAEILAAVCNRTTGAVQRTSSLLMEHLRHASAGDTVDTPPALSRLDRRHAVVLLRALLRAARANRDFDRREQDAVLRQLGDVIPEERRRLREAVASAPDVAGHTASVPIGMEREVYAVSLLALGRDASCNGPYLRRLATGLRLTPATCRRIHTQVGAPPLTV